MKIAFKTDAGQTHTKNEDAILVDKDRGLFLLADGMGGSNAGEEASDLAVKEAYACLKDRVEDVSGESSVCSLLTSALSRAHNVIKEKTAQGCNCFGSTLVIMLIKKGIAHVLHVGDSRVYLIREGIRQITSDHTFENYFCNNIAIQDLFSLQKGRAPVQAVGASREIRPESRQIQLRENDIILICSDGLYDMLSDEAILSITCLFRDDLDVTAAALIEAANKMGGKDNISVVLISV